MHRIVGFIETVKSINVTWLGNWQALNAFVGYFEHRYYNAIAANQRIETPPIFPRGPTAMQDRGRQSAIGVTWQF